VAAGQVGKAGAARPRAGEQEERGVGLGQRIGLGREGRGAAQLPTQKLFLFYFQIQIFPTVQISNFEVENDIFKT
jgi:hypothetical protein